MEIVNLDFRSVPVSFNTYYTSNSIFMILEDNDIEMPRKLENIIMEDIDDSQLIEYEHTPAFLFLDENIVFAKFYAKLNSPDSIFFMECEAILLNSIVRFRIYYSADINFIVIDDRMVHLIKKYNMKPVIHIYSGIIKSDNIGRDDEKTPSFFHVTFKFPFEYGDDIPSIQS